MYDNYIKIPYKYDNLDRYYVRNAILQSITKFVKDFGGSLLDVGAGNSPYKNYILKNSSVDSYLSIDIESENSYGENKPDIYWDGKTMPFENNTFDTIILTEVIEHVFDINNLLNEIFRVLKPGGIIFGTTPYLWTLHEVPYDYCRYTPFGLEHVLKVSNFIDIKIQSTGGWNASLAIMLGLWVRRSKMNRIKRRLLSVLLMPLIKRLISKNEKSYFNESQMIAGMSFIAKK